jgi:hypothetical protein
MGYNTMLRSPKLYCAYVKRQTHLLLEWASSEPGHRVLIGIPSYEHVPALSDPRVENIPNAASGVRAALEEQARTPSCFEGVAIYAHWVTDPGEWGQFRNHWLDGPRCIQGLGTREEP